MSITLRITLICVSVIVLVFVFRKIRKTDFVIEDSFFWILLCFLLLLISVFPRICYTFSRWLGFESPSNFVFLAIIFLLLVKEFFISVKVSRLQTKLTHLIQKYAIDGQTKEQITYQNRIITKACPSKIREYLNPLVIFAYVLFVVTTFLSIFAYRVIPLSIGPILEATGYIYVTIFGVTIFKEKINRKKILALVLIIGGISVYGLFG